MQPKSSGELASPPLLLRIMNIMDTIEKTMANIHSLCQSALPPSAGHSNQPGCSPGNQPARQGSRQDRTAGQGRRQANSARTRQGTHSKPPTPTHQAPGDPRGRRAKSNNIWVSSHTLDSFTLFNNV